MYLVYSNAHGSHCFSQDHASSIFGNFMAAALQGGLTMWLMLLGYFAAPGHLHGTIAVSYTISKPQRLPDLVLEPTTAALLGFLVLEPVISASKSSDGHCCRRHCLYAYCDKAEEVQAKQNEKKSGSNE